MRCFVTIGSTQFDALIETVLNKNVLSLLNLNGFDQLFIQCGSGKINAFFKKDINESWTYKFHGVDVSLAKDRKIINN